MDSQLTVKIFQFVILILSVNFHEFCHGLAAYSLGDDTAKRAGRLTLNPIAHIDPIGTLFLPALLLLVNAGFIFGWAKPVPYDPRALRDQKHGSLKVAIAGPLANFAIALLLTGLIRLLPAFSVLLSPTLTIALQAIAYVNILLGLFNLLPVPPLDGSKILADLSPRAGQALEKLGPFGLFIAMIFGLFLISPIAQIIFNFLLG